MEEQQHQLTLDTKTLFHRLCSLYREENADLSLCCGPGECLKAHRLILSLCSPLFEKSTSLQTEKATNNFIVMLDVKKPILKHILDLIYKGKVTISENELADFYKTLDQLKMSNIILKEKPITSECQTEDDENQAKNKDAASTPPRKTLVEILTEPQANMNLKISDSPRKNTISTKKRKAADVEKEVPNSNGDLVDLECLNHDQLNKKHTKTITGKHPRTISPQPSTSKYSDSPIRKNPFARSVHRHTKTNNKNGNGGDQGSNTLNLSPTVVVVDSDAGNRISSPQACNRMDGTDSDSTQSDIVTLQQRPTGIHDSSEESEAAARKKKYDKLLMSANFKFSNYKEFCCICNEMTFIYTHVRDYHRRTMKKNTRCPECSVSFRLVGSLKRHTCKKKSINQ